MTHLRVLALLAALLAAGGAWAQDALSLEAFFGRWEGSAIGKSVAASAPGYRARDLDVTISETADGFEISWVTVIRGQDDDADAAAERRATSARFVAAGGATWQAEATEAPPAGLSRSWARLEGSSLKVYVLEIDETGIYEIAQYERTITPAGVMDLKFTRIRDGRTVRQVTGSLLRAAK